MKRIKIFQAWQFLPKEFNDLKACLTILRPLSWLPVCRLFLAVAAIIVTESFGQILIHEALPARKPIDVQALAQKPPVPMSLNLAGAFQEGRNVHVLASLSAQEISAADQAAFELYASVHPGPARVGIVRSIGRIPLSLARDAVLQPLPIEEKKLWTLAIRSPGAFGIRVHFSDFDLGLGTAIVYAQTQDGLIVRGPFSGKGPKGDGDFWTASLPGETAFIEVSGGEEARFEIAEIVHLDKSAADPKQQKAESVAALPCHLDVKCYEPSQINPSARDASGQINFMKNGSAFVCSGTILNDLDDETDVPYFLTAYHCISSQEVTNTMEVVWFWQTLACDGATPDYFALPRNTGGTLLATNPTDGGNDMSFIRLNGDLPGGIAFAGWTTNRPDNGYGIHHPAGSWKRVTFLSNVGFCPGCEFCGDGTDYDYYDIDNGIIEGGSSGSGIFNNSGQLAGQLFGSCNLYNSDDLNCNNRDDFVAVYGEFETTYPIIRRWLELGGTIYVNRAYNGVELGTPTQPFNTVTEANDLAWDGSRIKIRAASYPERLIMNKKVTLLAEGGTVVIGQ